MDYEAFVYLWFDSKNRMFYLGFHKGHEDDGYTHSSTIMESFSKKNIPPYMRRRILARGSYDDMTALEVSLLKNRKEKCWDRYYNVIAIFPPPPRLGEDHPSYIDGRSKDPEKLRENNREAVRKCREKNPEKTRELSRKYRENNPEKARENWRRYRENNLEKERERVRNWREKNPEKSRESSRKYRQKNPERNREDCGKYYEKNREKILEKQRKYREKNREKIREKRRQSRAKKKLEKSLQTA